MRTPHSLTPSCPPSSPPKRFQTTGRCLSCTTPFHTQPCSSSTSWALFPILCSVSGQQGFGANPAGPSGRWVGWAGAELRRGLSPSALHQSFQGPRAMISLLSKVVLTRRGRGIAGVGVSVEGGAARGQQRAGHSLCTWLILRTGPTSLAILGSLFFLARWVKRWPRCMGARRPTWEGTGRGRQVWLAQAAQPAPLHIQTHRSSFLPTWGKHLAPGSADSGFSGTASPGAAAAGLLSGRVAQSCCFEP